MSYSDFDEDTASLPGDEKDRIIEQKQHIIEEMKQQFIDTLDQLQEEFNDYIESSADVQRQMLERIQELKTELNKLRKEQAKKSSSYRINRAPVKSTLSPKPKHPKKLAKKQEFQQ